MNQMKNIVIEGQEAFCATCPAPEEITHVLEALAFRLAFHRSTERRLPHMHHSSGGQGSPKNYTHRQGTGGKTATGQHLPDDTVFVPPLSMFLLGGGGILVALGANVWQVFTSFSAFFSM